MLPYLRLYDTSIYNYLRYEVVPLHFSEVVEDDSLTLDAATNTYKVNFSVSPDPASDGRGFVLFDDSVVGGRSIVDTSSEQTTKISVTGPTSYEVDYVRGRILNPDSPPTSISYSWYYVSVIQGWPGVSPPLLPVVALDIDSNVKTGFQLGGGLKDIVNGSIYIFATSEAEKKDIADIIHQSLFNKSIPINNWHEVSYLDYNGTYTNAVPVTVSGLSRGDFLEVSANFTSRRLDWSELNRHRAKIDFVFQVYRNF